MTATLERDQVILTPTARRFFRRASFWVVVGVLIIAFAIVYNLVSSASPDSQPLAADGTGTVGSGALVSVLEQHGVDVTTSGDLATTRAAVRGPVAATIMVYDPNEFLDAAQLREVEGLAAHVVFVSPNATQLKGLDPSLLPAGTARSVLTAGCQLPAARKAGTIADATHAYRVSSATNAATRCFGSGHGAYSLVRVTDAGGDLTVLGATAALTNQHVIDRGNAALAINLLGSTPRLVWYLPSVDDISASSRPESLGSATPQWVDALLVLACLVAIAAGVWRGRRFGALVVERLPVVVRSRETMEGRARLYQSSSARLHALDTLRIGAIDRIARLCGLPRVASLDAVVGRVAALTGRSEAGVRAILVDDIPKNDAALVRLSDALLDLERDVAAVTRPG